MENLNERPPISQVFQTINPAHLMRTFYVRLKICGSKCNIDSNSDPGQGAISIRIQNFLKNFDSNFLKNIASNLHL